MDFMSRVLLVEAIKNQANFGVLAVKTLKGIQVGGRGMKDGFYVPLI